MNKKSKGSSVEREILHKYYDMGYGACRIAGSGSMPIELPDIIVGKNGENYAIEVKYVSGTKCYISKKQIDDLIIFANKMNFIPRVMVKFKNKGIYSYSVYRDLVYNDSTKTRKNYVAKIENGIDFKLEW